MNTFSVKNFEKFQHYKDRSPPWIKLYNELLDDYEFGRLQDASKMHLVAIWLLASRYDNQIPYDAEWVSRRINATEPVDLIALARSGFIILDQSLIDLAQDASKPLAKCLTRERERDRGREEEVDDDAGAREVPEILISEAAVTIADEVASIAGLDPADRMATPPGWCGAAAQVQTWLAHWPRETILAGARAAMARKRDGPPGSPKYFERPIAQFHLQLTRPMPEIVDIGRAYENERRRKPKTMDDVANEVRAEIAAKRRAGTGS